LQRGPAEVAQAWLLAQPVVSSVILGSATEDQLDLALKSGETMLDDETLVCLDEIFPPVGAAPESYAW